MITLEDLSATYGVKPGNLVTAKFPCYGIEHNGVKMYGFVVPNIADGEPTFTFAYDSYMINKHVEMASKFPGVVFNSPALDIKMEGLTIDEMTSNIKTKKSLFTSTMNDVSFKVDILNEDTMKETLEAAGTKYDNVFHDKHEKYLMFNGYTGFITRGYVIRDGVTKEEIYRLMWFRCGGDLVGTTIVSTEDEELRKKYSPNIIGHYWLMKYGINSEADRVRFSLFYPYKKIFGVEPTMYPCIPKDVLMKYESLQRITQLEELADK